MPMKNPPHPGRNVRLTCLEPLALSVTEAARHLGVTRQALNNVVNEKSAISPEMALRFEKMGWGTADGWMNLQTNFDLARVRARAEEISVAPMVETGRSG